MSDLPTAVSAFFGLKKTRKEKLHHIGETQNGFMKVYRSPDTQEQILFQHRVKEYAAANGFPDTDRLICTGGEPFFRLGRDFYVMTPYIKGRDMVFSCQEDMRLATKTLAQFHRAAKGLAIETPNLFTRPPVTAHFAKQSAFLSATLKQVRTYKRLSDFDVLFLKHAKEFSEKIQTAQYLLDGTDYVCLYNEALAGNYISHNALKEETLPMHDKTCYLTYFSEISIDIPLMDIAALIRRHAQRAAGDAVPIAELLDIYHAAHPLPDCAPVIIRALLTFPWLFMKIIAQYYSKKRSFTPTAMMGRLDAYLKEKESFDTYIH